eukprot:6050432-Amphidinium_carterae.1
MEPEAEEGFEELTGDLYAGPITCTEADDPGKMHIVEPVSDKYVCFVTCTVLKASTRFRESICETSFEHLGVLRVWGMWGTVR